MPLEPRPSARRFAEVSAVVVLCVIAAIARLWHLTAGLPHAVGIDEPQVVDRAIRILRTGDWNTHAFDYPTLVIYFQAAVGIARFLWGAVTGEWASLDGFTITAIYTAGRFVAAMIGVATVWLVYRLGIELASRRVALLAAAQLAVHAMHVRESHFILTDVPMTALTTMAVWLAVRAARLGSIRSYAWAGAACGLAGAAKYNGAIAIVAVAAVWVLNDRGSADRGRKAGAAGGAALGAFLLGAPYTALDLPGFLNGFAAQFARFAGGQAEASWRLYVKHLSHPDPIWVPLAAAGVVVVLWRGHARRRWTPPVLFTAAYFYILSSHSHVLGRYALPLVPMLCLFTSVAVIEALRLLQRVPGLGGPQAQRLVFPAVVVALLAGPVVETVRWLDGLKRPDTRAVAADWLTGHAPKGSRLAVENSGPTYLSDAGFRVVPTELLLEHPAAWYRANADYLIVSAADLTRYGEYFQAGPSVFQIAPTPQRWGPPVVIVQVSSKQ